MSFVEQKLLIKMQYNLSTFAFMINTSWFLFDTSLQPQDHEDISSGSFIAYL